MLAATLERYHHHFHRQGNQGSKRKGKNSFDDVKVIFNQTLPCFYELRARREGGRTGGLMGREDRESK